MFDGFQVVHLAGGCFSLGVDAGPHRDLRIDAAVLAIGFDGLRNQQNSNAEQTEAADGGKHGVRMSSHHFANR